MAPTTGCCKPNPNVNYSFLAMVYAAASVLTGVLLWLEMGGITTAVNGYWIVPAPALPSLVYALVMRAKVAAAPAGTYDTAEEAPSAGVGGSDDKKGR